MLERFLYTEEGAKCADAETPKILMPSTHKKHKVNINGVEQTAKSVTVLIEVNGEQKEVAIDGLFCLVCDILEYAKFKFEKYVKKIITDSIS